MKNFTLIILYLKCWPVISNETGFLRWVLHLWRHPHHCLYVRWCNRFHVFPNLVPYVTVRSQIYDSHLNSCTMGVEHGLGFQVLPLAGSAPTSDRGFGHSKCFYFYFYYLHRPIHITHRWANSPNPPGVLRRVQCLCPGTLWHSCSNNLSLTSKSSGFCLILFSLYASFGPCLPKTQCFFNALQTTLNYIFSIFLYSPQTFTH